MALSTSFQSTPKSHTFSWTFNLRLSSSPGVAITLQWHITVAKHYITLKGTAANSMGEKQTHQSKERSERPVNMNFPESHGPLPAVRLETAASVRAVGTAAEILKGWPRAGEPTLPRAHFAVRHLCPRTDRATRAGASSGRTARPVIKARAGITPSGRRKGDKTRPPQPPRPEVSAHCAVSDAL